MLINYKFKSDTEPTDEQLHLLMQEVAIEAKNKTQKSDHIFQQQLQHLLDDAKKQRLKFNADAK